MTSFVREVSSDELQKYVVSSKSCKTSITGCKLKPKTSHVTFNLSVFGGIKSCTLHCRRIGGNGVIVISEPPVGNLVVSSKNSQTIDIVLNKKNIINISRPNFSTGEIEIYGMSLQLNSNKEKGKGVNARDWKRIIAKCGTYRGLRLVKGELFASEGGYISNSHIVKNIETEPPELYKRSNDRIQFLSSCKVKKIDLGNNNTPIPISKEIFPQRKAPSPMAVSHTPDQEANAITKINPSNAEIIKALVDEGNEKTLSSEIVYDTQSNRGLSIAKTITSKFIKHIVSNGAEYVLIRKQGKLQLPLPSLRRNTDYICIVHSKKFNGNGKFFVRLIEDNKPVDQSNSIVVSTNLSNKYASLRTTAAAPSGDFYKLQIEMPEGQSAGEILINRIIIIENNRAKLCEIDATFSVPNIITTNLICDKYGNSVYKVSKIFADYSCDNLQSTTTWNDVCGNVTSTTVSGLRWLRKIKSFFPNLNIVNPDDDNADKLVFGNVGTLKRANKIWIDVFDDLTGNDVNILSEAKVIFTPSENNKKILEKKCPDSEIKIGHKALPFVQPTKCNFFESRSFVLAFDRGTTTPRLIRAWNKNLPNLVLVGARGRFPDCVFCVNEYLPYNELLFLMLKANCIVDLSEYDEYVSSFLHLALGMGKPIVSSNEFITDKDDCFYLKNNDKEGDIPVPSVKDIQEKVKKAVDLGKQIDFSRVYNNELKTNVFNFFGVTK